MELVIAKKIPPRGDTKNAMRPPIVRTVGNICETTFSSFLGGGRLYPILRDVLVVLGFVRHDGANVCS